MSRMLSEPEWDEILNVVLPLYLEKSLKELLKVIPKNTVYAQVLSSFMLSKFREANIDES